MEVPRLITDRAYSTYESMIEKEVSSGEMPRHIAIIMDGNRRYAEEVLGAEPKEGHKLGRQKLDEVSYLMELLEQSLYEFADNPEVHSRRVAINVIGDVTMLPDGVVKAMEYAKERTAGYSDNYLNMAIAYSGRQDITNAIRMIAKDVLEGNIGVDDIDESLVSNYISTTGLPDPDLVLRTSGEVRISNFLLWQMAYSELYFADVYWPGFRHIDFLRAIRTFQQRKRRFGK